MSGTEQRIAIAKACGVLVRLDDAIYRRMYQEWDDAQDPLFCLTPPCRWKLVGHDSIPDYPNDLNAMHDAESVLKEPQRTLYLNYLISNGGPSFADCEWAQVHATAAQRAEAFLRTMGKWVDK